MSAGRIEQRPSPPLAALLEVAAEARAESLEGIGTTEAPEEVRLLGALSDPTADMTLAIEALSEPAVAEQVERLLDGLADRCDQLIGLETHAPEFLPPRELAMFATRFSAVSAMAKTVKKLVQLKREARKRQRGRSNA